MLLQSMLFLIAAIFFAAAALGFLREPRRLRVGVLLLAAIATLGLAILGEVFGRSDDQYNQAAGWILLGLIAAGLLAVVTLALFLLYNGIVMLRRERRSLPNMLSLLLGGALLVYVGIGYVAIASSDALLATILLLTVPPVAWLGSVFCAFLLYAWIYGRFAARFGRPATTVVVLGAGLIGGRVTPLLASRLELGKHVFDRSRARGATTQIIVSGGQGPDEVVAEGTAMAGWLVQRGVPNDEIIPETASTTTEENLRFSWELVEDRARREPVAVVTSDFHAFRAATLMRALGMPGYSVGAPTARYYWPSAMIREFVALLRDNVKLNLFALSALTLPFLVFTGSLIVGAIG